jgi:hypothetical protein
MMTDLQKNPLKELNLAHCEERLIQVLVDASESSVLTIKSTNIQT